MGKRRQAHLVFRVQLVLAAVGAAACAEAPLEPYVYRAPEQTGDGLRTGAAESVGLDAGPLEAGTNAVQSKTYGGVDSFLVVRDDLLVHEAYFDDYNRDKPHDLRSATKSITSALVGIAIDQGLLGGVDEPALPHLGGEAGLRNFDPRKREITLEDLLTMTPGLACDDWNSSSPGNEAKMYEERDWVKFIFDLPMVADPGTQYGYCTGGVVALGAVLGEASGQRADAYARQVLFSRLGISGEKWEYTPTGAVDTGGHIRLRPRDMAKFGQLFLRRGTWGGERIVSQEWVDRSTSFRVRTNLRRGVRVSLVAPRNLPPRRRAPDVLRDRKRRPTDHRGAEPRPGGGLHRQQLRHRRNRELSVGPLRSLRARRGAVGGTSQLPPCGSVAAYSQTFTPARAAAFRRGPSLQPSTSFRRWASSR